MRYVLIDTSDPARGLDHVGGPRFQMGDRCRIGYRVKDGRVLGVYGEDVGGLVIETDSWMEVLAAERGMNAAHEVLKS